jgi:hypothetical protein
MLQSDDKKKWFKVMTQKWWHMLIKQRDENVDITNCDPKWKKTDVANRFHKAMTQSADKKR